MNYLRLRAAEKSRELVDPEIHPSIHVPGKLVRAPLRDRFRRSDGCCSTLAKQISFIQTVVNLLLSRITERNFLTVNVHFLTVPIKNIFCMRRKTKLKIRTYYLFNVH